MLRLGGVSNPLTPPRVVQIIKKEQISSKKKMESNTTENLGSNMGCNDLLHMESKKSEYIRGNVVILIVIAAHICSRLCSSISIHECTRNGHILRPRTSKHKCLVYKVRFGPTTQF